MNPAVNKRFYMARSVSVTSDVSNDKFSVPSVLLVFELFKNTHIHMFIFERESHFVSSDELGTASLCVTIFLSSSTYFPNGVVVFALIDQIFSEKVQNVGNNLKILWKRSEK